MIWLSGFRAVLEALGGPLSTKDLAGSIFALYFGLAYVAPLLGWLARNIPGARLFEQPGIDHAPWRSDVVADLVDEVRHFLTGSRGVVEIDRILATVLFTDIVGSTERSLWRSRMA
jgi:hypothetical protein